MMDESTSLWSIKRTQVILWLAFTAEPLASVALLLVWRSTQSDRLVKDTVSCPGWVAYLFAVLLAAASVFVRRLFLSERLVKARLESEESEPDVLPMPGNLGARDERVWSLSRHYLTPTLMAWSLNGFITVGGLMCLFTEGDEVPVIILSFAALVLNALAYPRFDRFVERIEGLGQDWEGI
jgi:hypothetical protein